MNCLKAFKIFVLVIESKHEGSKEPIITRKHGAGGPKKSQKPQSNVFYSEYSKSFFNLTYFPETSAWNITSNGPLKMPIKIKVRIYQSRVTKSRASDVTC